MILSFLSAKNGVLRSNKSFFVEKIQKIFILKIPQIHFYCILSRNFSKITKFSKLFVKESILKIPQIHFYYIFKSNFFKNFLNFEFFVKRAAKHSPTFAKKIWETTRKNRREQGFYSCEPNLTFGAIFDRSYRT